MFTTELGTPCETRNALRALQAAARQVGLPGIGLHTLRHYAAAVMLVNGCRSRSSLRCWDTRALASPETSTATSPRMCHATRSPCRRRLGDKRWS